MKSEVTDCFWLIILFILFEKTYFIFNLHWISGIESDCYNKRITLIIRLHFRIQYSNMQINFEIITE